MKSPTTSDRPQQAVARLEVPENLHRNAPGAAAAGYENGGQYLMFLAQKRCGLDSLADVDVLDVGCGVRFTMTIINRRIPIRSYTGLEVENTIVEFLNQSVAACDSRFKFLHWNAQNELYRPGGVDLSRFERLPTDESFDIVWAFSLFTHQCPSDSAALLRILRKNIRPGGKLFFSAFIDSELNGFEDRVKGSPLLHAYYGRALMESIVFEAGWKVEGFYEPETFIQHSFLCSPLK